MITLSRFRLLEQLLRDLGYGPTIEWSEAIQPPTDADDFAKRAIYVICSSGMRVTVAGPIYERCIEAVRVGSSAQLVFGHRGKARAIDSIWTERATLFENYTASAAPLEFLAQLPWIGPVTKHHLAKNLGSDTAKPDVHLERLAARQGNTPFELCQELARATGYKVATVDTILWRACAEGLLNSRVFEVAGWQAAFRGCPMLESDRT